VGEGVSEVLWQPVDELPPLAFDHEKIVRRARSRLKQKILYEPVLFGVLPEHFTMADLRSAHKAIDSKSYDSSNFARQMLSRWDLAPIPGVRDRRTRRPAKLFRYQK